MSLAILEQMHVAITGNGPDILMLHGLGGSVNNFQPIVTELEKDYRIIRPELPGSARSRTPLSLTFESIVDRLMAIMETLSIQQVHLMGHSLGTLLCQMIAIRVPTKISSLNLLGPLTEPPEVNREGLKQRASLVRQQGMASVIDTIVSATTCRQTQTDKPVVIGMIRQLLEAQSDQGYALTCEALADSRAVNASQIACPVMMLTGEDDVITPPSMMFQLADQIQGSRNRVLAHCGHWTMLEQPVECARDARAFLDSLPR